MINKKAHLEEAHEYKEKIQVVKGTSAKIGEDCKDESIAEFTARK